MRKIRFIVEESKVKEGLRMPGERGRKSAEELRGLCHHRVRCSNPSSASS